MTHTTLSKQRRQRRSPGGNHHLIAAKVKVFHKWVKRQGQKSQGKKLWHHVKGLVTMNTYVHYETLSLLV